MKRRARSGRCPIALSSGDDRVLPISPRGADVRLRQLVLCRYACWLVRTRHLQDPSKNCGIVENGADLLSVKPGDGVLKAVALLDLGACRSNRNVDLSRFAPLRLGQGPEM